MQRRCKAHPCETGRRAGARGALAAHRAGWCHLKCLLQRHRHRRRRCAATADTHAAAGCRTSLGCASAAIISDGSGSVDCICICISSACAVAAITGAGNVCSSCLLRRRSDQISSRQQVAAAVRSRQILCAAHSVQHLCRRWPVEHIIAVTGLHGLKSVVAGSAKTGSALMACTRHEWSCPLPARGLTSCVMCNVMTCSRHCDAT